MKNISNNYKTNIKNFGRELDSKITYIENEEEIELSNTQLNSITPHYEGSILKSVMKQLDIDSNVEIPEGTELNYKFGIKIDNDYEYIDYGNYIVYKVEKQEDTTSYKIVCYDKMLYAMKSYEKMNITYPITIRNYINAICDKLNLTFANINDNFANYDKQIQTELYLSYNETQHDYTEDMGYTFRDVLDELAQVTASTICINENDELEIRYINNTLDTINEEYLKNINVNFGEKYGPINSIVLSRAGDSDKVYLKDDESIAQNGLCEINISENQIMNFNDRSNYLPDILNALDGLEYYLNDFSSTGITYYDLCDRYNVQIGDNTYSCVMFNDEVNITQGLEENIHTDMPEETETNYEKADKTDRKINQTYIIVDKQNQIIESVINNVSQQNDKISQITQTVDELNSKIQDIADITISGESEFATFTLDNINESEPIVIKVRPIAASNNISYVYPHNNLYPASNLYSKTRTIRFTNEKEYEETTDVVYTSYKNYFYYDGVTYFLLEKGSDYQVGNTITGTIYQNKQIDYILPDDLLYYDNEHYDEFYLDYDSQTCQITKRCEYNSDGTISLLANEEIVDYPYPTIQLTTGDYKIELLGYEYGYLFVRLMASNIYTSQFATRVEVSSQINQTAQEINLEVAKKTNKDEIISTINQTAEQIQISANKISLAGKTIQMTSDNININSTNFKVDKDGNITANNATLNSGVFKGNINTNESCTVGDNLYVGTNQSAGSSLRKMISLSENSNITRVKFASSDLLSVYSSGTVQVGTSSKKININDGGFNFNNDDGQTINSMLSISPNFGTYIDGDLNVAGAKNRVVEIDNSKKVKLNAYETATPYFGDIGSNKTNNNGECTIEIEDIFSQTIEEQNYKVFVQECGDGKLWVEKHSDYFIVKGTPNLEFDWEIKAIQKGYSNVRLEEYKENKESDK